MNATHQNRKRQFKNWTDNHKKQILIGVLICVFCELVLLSVRFYNYKDDKPLANELLKFKKTTRKIQASSKNKYSEYASVQALYLQAQTIMKKDSVTKADYAQLKLIDSTMRTLIKK